MKRITVLLLSLLLCLPTFASAAETDPIWSRPVGDGSYVTVRVPCPEAEDLPWAQSRWLSVRYADTKEPVPLSGEQLRNYIFATVPASEKDRPLEVFQGQEFGWTDIRYPPMDADILNIRGVLRGDHQGRLNLKYTLSRAEAVVLVSRMLSLPAGKAPGYADVPADAWYADAVASAKAAGLLENNTHFYPHNAMARWELMDLIDRAFSLVGWLDDVPEDTPLDLQDADKIPAAARGAYRRLNAHSISLYTLVYTEELDPFDLAPMTELWAEPHLAATREDAIELLYSCLTRLQALPFETAIQWGFDQAMPVVDGSTSTYPYTQALYGSLFSHYGNHPQYPASHSKSHASYERLIRGEVDALFAATKASRELEAQAAAAGVTLEYIPIAYDAMVFFTNSENTIDGLTRRQVQDIYARGLYDNWTEVGGPDAALLPYCRNTDSGSHSLMERYFLEDGALSLHDSVTTVNVSTAMTSALTDVAEALVKEPPAYAMGYSVYYYYQTMQTFVGEVTANRLKLLEIDGVAPTDETIADGSYPLADYNYLVIRADAPADSPARQLAKFMLSPQGQQIVANAGFGPLSPQN